MEVLHRLFAQLTKPVLRRDEVVLLVHAGGRLMPMVVGYMALLMSIRFLHMLLVGIRTLLGIRRPVAGKFTLEFLRWL